MLIRKSLLTLLFSVIKSSKFILSFSISGNASCFTSCSRMVYSCSTPIKRSSIIKSVSAII